MPEEQHQDDHQDPVEVLQAAAEPERDLAEAAVPSQGAAVAAATAKPHDRKAQMEAAIPDAPAEVTDVHVRAAAVEFHENRNAAAAAVARESRGRAEEAERIVPQEAAAADEAVAAVAQEEVRSAEAALIVAGRESTTHARPGFGLVRAEEVRAPARFRDAEAGVPKLGIDHAPSRPPDLIPLALAPHSGTAM